MTKKTALRINSKIYYGWMIVFVSGLSIFFSAPGQTFSISAFIDAYIDTFNFSRTTISTIYSIATLCSGLLLFVIGKLVDKFGQKLMLVICGSLLALSSFYNSFVTTIPMVAIGFFLSRYFGQGALTMIPSTLVPQWFKKKRAFAFSLFKFGGTVASVVVPIFNIYIITNFGWQVTWRIWSILLFLLFVPTALLLVINTPEMIGLKPDNLKLKKEDLMEEAIEIEKESWHVKEAVKTKSFWFLGICSMLTPLIVTGLVFHFYSIMSEKLIDSQSAALILGLMGIPGFVFPMVAGFIIDHIGAKNILVGTFVIEVIGLIMLNVSGSVAVSIASILILGIGTSTNNVACGVMWPNFFGRKYLGSIQSIATIFLVVGSALGPMPFGIIFDLTNSYMIVLYSVAILALCGAILAYFTNQPKKEKLTRK